MIKLIREDVTLDGFEVFTVGPTRRRRSRKISDAEVVEIERVVAQAKADGYHYGPFQTAPNVLTYGYALRAPTAAERANAAL